MKQPLVLPGKGPERYANTHLRYAETRDAILYKTWRRLALERWINPSASTIRTVALNFALSKRSSACASSVVEVRGRYPSCGNPVNWMQQLWIAG